MNYKAYPLHAADFRNAQKDDFTELKYIIYSGILQECFRASLLIKLKYRNRRNTLPHTLAIVLYLQAVIKKLQHRL